MPVPDFSPGEVLTAAAMDSIGLWLVKTQTIGASVSSVPVADVFSADYENYRIIVTGGATVAATAMALQLTGSTPNNYYSAGAGITYAGAGSNISEANSSQWSNAGGGFPDGLGLDVTLYNPFLSRRTGVSFNARVDYRTNGAATSGNGYHNVSASFTGFTLSTASAMTGGVIRVYGFRN